MKTILGMAVSAVVFAAAPSAFAANAASVGAANATARIIRPSSITMNSSLRFGAIAKPGAGTVGRTTANVASANFTVSGDGARAFTLVIDRTVTLTNTAASGGALTVTTVNDAACAASCALTGELGDAANGAKNVNIGGSLSLAANTKAGAYAGTMNIGVTYN